MRNVFMTLLLLISFVLQASAQDKAKNDSLVKKISDHVYQLEQLTIDTKERTVTLPARVNMQKGLIEVFLCSRGGKVHESIFVTDVIPYYLQVALLMIGLEPSDPDQYQNRKAPLTGDPVQIDVTWEKDDEDVRYRAHELVWNMATESQMEETEWIFTGSRHVNGTFMADDIKSLITTYNDPFTIIDNPLATGSNDELYIVYEERVPLKETLVTISIKALP